MKLTTTLAGVFLLASFVAPPTLRAQESKPQAKGPNLKSDEKTTTSFAQVGSNGTLISGSKDAETSFNTGTGSYVVNFEEPLGECAAFGQPVLPGFISLKIFPTAFSVFVTTTDTTGQTAMDNEFYLSLVCR